MSENKQEHKNFLTTIKDNIHWIIIALGIIIACWGGVAIYNSHVAKFADTNQYLNQAVKKVDLSTLDGNFRTDFKNGNVIKQFDTKNHLMKTTYTYNDGIIPTGKIIISTVEEVNIKKQNSNKTDVTPTGKLIALSASSNDLKNSNTQTVNKAKSFIAEQVSNIVNGEDKDLASQVKNHIKITKNAKGQNILWLESGKMKSDLTSNYSKGTTKNDEYIYSNAFLMSNNGTKVRNANEKVLSLNSPFFARYQRGNQ